MEHSCHALAGGTSLRRSTHIVAALIAVLLGVGLGTSAGSRQAGGAEGRAAAQSASQKTADVVVMDAKIYTEDPERSVVQALAVSDGKIVFAGSASEAAKFVGPKTVVEREGGKLVLPGLVDAHIHPVGIVDFGGCDLESKARTLAEIAEFVHSCVERMHVPSGQWLAVSNWEYGGGNQADAAHPTVRAALDAASRVNPIVMTGWDEHHGAYNSAALALAKNAKGEVVGYSKRTLSTDFAQYKTYVGVDANGEPTGDITDQGKIPIDSSAVAKAYFDKLVQEPERLAQRLNSAGITAVQDAAVGVSPLGPSPIRVYDELIQRGQLTFRINMAQYYIPETFRDSSGRIDYDRLFSQADTVRRKYAPNPLVRADAIKVFADGVPEANPNNIPPTLGNSPRPVPYLQPIFEKDANGKLSVKGYVDIGSPVCAYVRAKPEEYVSSEAVADFIKTYGYHPGQCAISYGIPEHAPAIFNEYVKRAHLAGYTVHIHAISDQAVHMAIDAIEAARSADGNDSRPDTIAHIQFASPEDVARMGRDHLYLAFTYSWMYAEPTGYDMSVVPFFNKVLGNTYEALHDPQSYYEQLDYPTKTTKEAGAILVAGSDAPVLTKDPQPFVNMEFGVTRARHGLPPESPHQRLDIRDLIDAYTINGARALGRASEIGSLETGKSADFVVVDQDILTLAHEGHLEQIGNTKVVETWFMGRKVYAAAHK
ncbi:MAG TPA: amidohydrolase family protein [Terriglobales bacterium]|nr:amidohydrolase family protein [Terriglobales bacterium]